MRVMSSFRTIHCICPVLFFSWCHRTNLFRVFEMYPWWKKRGGCKCRTVLSRASLGAWQGACARMLSIISRPENNTQEASLLIFCSNLKIMYLLKRCFYYFISDFHIIILVFLLLFGICPQKLENSTWMFSYVLMKKTEIPGEQLRRGLLSCSRLTDDAS